MIFRSLVFGSTQVDSTLTSCGFFLQTRTSYICPLEFIVWAISESSAASSNRRTGRPPPGTSAKGRLCDGSTTPADGTFTSGFVVPIFELTPGAVFDATTAFDAVEFAVAARAGLFASTLPEHAKLNDTSRMNKKYLFLIAGRQLRCKICLHGFPLRIENTEIDRITKTPRIAEHVLAKNALLLRTKPKDRIPRLFI